MGKTWAVHKFGGTSVADAERYRKVSEILAGPEAPGPDGRVAVVVSAMSKVTDALLELVRLAQARDDAYQAKLEAVVSRHLGTLAELVPEAALREPLEARIRQDAGELKEVLRGVFLTRTPSERATELVAGHGELWSAQLLQLHLRMLGMSADWLDARQVLVVEAGPDTAGTELGQGTVSVDWDTSRARLQAWLKDHPSRWVVVTGFIASTRDGIPTTLRRNGSDYSASIFGSLLKAELVTIWTDVDGVLSADPRRVPEAVVLDELSYAEATELAYFGAKVLHPGTMAPAVRDGIPIRIRNALQLGHPGTLIRAQSRSASGPVKGFTTIDEVALINVEGTGMMGVPGVAHRIFGSLKEAGISVVMISQASSEHSVCLAVREGESELARQTLEKTFFAELHHGQIERVERIGGLSVLAAVGDRMVESRGVAGRFFSALGSAGVNVRAIAQGSSERNISAVVDRAEATRALRAAHSGFFLSEQVVAVGVIGTGLIGGTFLDQLERARERLRKEMKVDFRVRAVSDSKRMRLGDPELKLAGWRETSGNQPGEPVDLDRLAAFVRAEHLPHAVLIDCTASAQVAGRYAGWLRQGLHVISPNKKANAGALDGYRAIRLAMREAGRHFLYSTNVGAGLPVINTLRELVRTGDRVARVEGILSGTLSFIFNTYDGTQPFSAVVAEARRLGYTEPDPRDDLAGTDVARKLVILAREMGLEVELSQVQVESLVPPGLDQGGPEDFLKALPAHDQAMRARVEEARARGEVLRYVGSIEGGRCSVGLHSYPATHAFARIGGSDNIVGFTTARYDRQPLVIQGPGAGPEVTAGGVFADLLRLSSYLGALP